MKKICVVTATRAEYGLLYWTMKEIEKSSQFQLQVVATGMHLSKKFGNTWEQIEKDGFKISSKVELGELGNSRDSVIEQVSVGVSKFSKVFDELKPEAVVLLGDRYETLSVAQVCLFKGIPIVHIHGGEVTAGAFDDAVRHSITKMSSLHFASAEEYRKRIIQLGESPETVFNVGAPGLENFIRLDLMDGSQLEESLGFKLKEKNLLLTYHPVTNTEEKGLDALISALSELTDVGQIITLPNSDPGHDEIFSKWQKYATGRENVLLVTSLGQIRYLSTMKIVNAVVGNSSSGIIEAPFCGVSTVNIGDRQKGRIFSDTVTQVSHLDKESILSAINGALCSNNRPQDTFGDGQTASKIVKILEKNLDDINLAKGFYDLNIGD